MDSGKDFPIIRRGRPRVLDSDMEHALAGIYGFPSTLRTTQNFFFRSIAGDALGGAFPSKESRDRWGWLLRCGVDGAPHFRKTIMAQLGRVRCKTALRIFADRLCELRPTAAVAVRLVRRWSEVRDNMLAALIVSESVSEEHLPMTLETVARRAIAAAGGSV